MKDGLSRGTGIHSYIESLLLHKEINTQMNTTYKIHAKLTLKEMEHKRGSKEEGKKGKGA